MSNDTAETPKKFSILTDAAMRAKARMTPDNSIESDDTTPKKLNIKKFAIGIGAVTAGAVAVYGALKLINANIAEVEPASDEDDESTD
jgi:uncharacterized protein YgiM (DUF1202 family)